MASAPLSPQREPVGTVLANMSHSAFDYACGDGPARRDGLGVVEVSCFVREVSRALVGAFSARGDAIVRRRARMSSAATSGAVSELLVTRVYWLSTSK